MKNTRFTKNVHKNLHLIQEKLNNTDDLMTREFIISFQSHPSKEAALLFFDGMVSNQVINAEILRPLLIDAKKIADPTNVDIIDFAYNSLITSAELLQTDYIEEALLAVMSGETLLLINGSATALIIDTKEWEERGVEAPQSEAVIRGPRDSFTENINQNLMLVRRRLRDPNLVFKRMRLGARGQNDIVVAYINELANPDIVKEVETRLDKIQMDLILDSSYIEQLIEDNWWTPFNTIQDTERPDESVAGLLEGRVLIFVDNTPYVLLAPATFNSLMLSPEDYYLRWPSSNFIRVIRFVASFAAIVTPGAYIALVAFHPGMIPTQLALSIAATREGIPFPTFVEALIMEISLELLREAGIRLPGPIGQTIGIVGGLIIGDAAVRANIVSPVMVIVVALTAIAGFVIPTYTFGVGIRLLRFFLMVMASLLGLYGLALGMLLILGHLASLTSFGVSYLSPWAPLDLNDLKDSLFRAPWHLSKKRPNYTRVQESSRSPKKKQIFGRKKHEN